MYLTNMQTLGIIAAVAIGTMITRFLPFFAFPDNKKVPPIISYFGKVLPTAMMGLLIVYCLKDVSFIKPNYGLPELVSIAFIIIVHKLKHNTFLSIFAGTALYMILVSLIG